jgi:hypothetical protein
MAAELARHGLSCRIVDSLEAPSRLSRALVVQSRTLELFDDFGLAERLLERGQPIGGYNVIGAGGRRARMPMKAYPWLETRYPFPLMVPQDATETVLTEYLASFGLAVERGVSFEGFRRLDTYELERRRVGQKLLEATDRRLALMSSGGPWVRRLRAHVMPLAAQCLFWTPFMQRKLLRFVSELFINYRRSPLSTESISGPEAGGARLADGPAPGERVPDLPVRGEGVERLHDVLRGPHHTLLLFAGLVPGRQTATVLESLARQLEEAYGPALLRARAAASAPERMKPKPRSTMS